MFRTILDIIKMEYSGERAKEFTTDISRFHRIQASPGFREAAYYVKKHLDEWNIDCNILQLKADGKTQYLGTTIFEEWEINNASLHLIEPEKKILADFKGTPTSIIQRSAPFTGEVELIILEDGEEESEYEGLELKGKAVLTKGNIHRVYDLAVEKYGATGIIYDGMKESPPVRGKMELPKGVEYSAFWWSLDSKKAFGFVLSPQQGVYLRELIKKTNIEKKPPVKIKVKVDSRIYPGYFEVVEAFFPGETKEEIIILAHLCHPQPSANDNASGNGALLEITRTLKTLLSENKLPPLKRGIRLLWVPEMTGTYGYLATYPERRENTIAGVNLDMVGEKQEETHSTLRLINTPMSLPSFVNTLMSRIGDTVSREDESLDAVKGEVIPLFKIASTPYSGGSDHYILTDPTIGIPCLMLGQWPDLYYHTSLDTPDKVDPFMLFASGVMSATYALFIANAQLNEVFWLGREMVTSFKKRILTLIQKEVNKNITGFEEKVVKEKISEDNQKKAGICFREQINFLLDRESVALDSLKKLHPNYVTESFKEELKTFVEDEIKKVRHLLKEEKDFTEECKGEIDLETQASQKIPLRVHPGPILITWYHHHRLTPDEKERWYNLSKEHPYTFREVTELGLYWADGKRSIQEISRLVKLECGKKDLKLLIDYFSMLEKLELIKYIEK